MEYYVKFNGEDEVHIVRNKRTKCGRELKNVELYHNHSVLEVCEKCKENKE